MTTEQYKSMVAMLIAATKNRKLSWIESNDDFYTDIDGCTLWVCTQYDFNVNVSTYTLKLYNKDKVLFETFTYSEDTNSEEYQQLEVLYENIRDVLYKITESEHTILTKLERLTISKLPKEANHAF